MEYVSAVRQDRRLGSRAMLCLLVALPLSLLTAAILRSPGRLPDTDRLGMTVEFDHVPSSGAPALLVTSLRSQGAARGAGLMVGDRIERIDGEAPVSARQVERAMGRRGTHHLTVHRKAATVRADLTIV